MTQIEKVDMIEQLTGLINSELADELGMQETLFNKLEDLDINSKEWNNYNEEVLWVGGKINGLTTALTFINEFRGE